MTMQQWLFSPKERIGRHNFWIQIGLWITGMLVLFSLANKQLLGIQTAAFCLVYPLWPAAAVTVKCLHDRGCSEAWALLVILAWMLLAGNWVMLPGVQQWAVDRFISTLILVGMLIDLGAFIGIQDANKYGKDMQDIKHGASPQVG